MDYQMNDQELSDYVLDGVKRAKELTKGDNCMPAVLGYIAELNNYYNRLEKSPDDFSERRGFLVDFKEHFAAPYLTVIENLEERCMDVELSNIKNKRYWALEIKGGALTALVGGIMAAKVHPEFGALVVAGAVLIVHGAYCAYKTLTYTGKEIRSNFGISLFFEDKIKVINSIEIEQLDDVLIDHQEEIKAILQNE
ncbi:hypothetical protein GOV03_00635 [Candidatus Woesearchaeota archaeon]|nr:hypothetical protein [Candidatus Woesearchaeota archaeon]